MGFKLHMAPPAEGAEAMPMLQPPDTDASTELGRLNRERLLRAWVELGATLVDFRRRFRTFSDRFAIPTTCYLIRN